MTKFYCPDHWDIAQRLAYFSRPDTKSECILWAGPVNEHGYGKLTWKYRKYYAHRLTWIKERGPIPKGLKVLHTCDTPGCVKLKHLFLGTQADNIADMVAKDRQSKGAARSAVLPRGEDQWNAKLTEQQAIEIFKAPGLQREVAEKYNVHHSLVSHIKCKRIWKHIHPL